MRRLPSNPSDISAAMAIQHLHGSPPSWLAAPPQLFSFVLCTCQPNLNTTFSPAGHQGAFPSLLFSQLITLLSILHQMTPLLRGLCNLPRSGRYSILSLFTKEEHEIIGHLHTVIQVRFWSQGLNLTSCLTSNHSVFVTDCWRPHTRTNYACSSTTCIDWGSGNAMV